MLRFRRALQGIEMYQVIAASFRVGRFLVKSYWLPRDYEIHVLYRYRGSIPWWSHMLQERRGCSYTGPHALFEWAC